MCGFVAMYGQTDEALLRRMMDQIRHRGPDGDGVLEVGECLLGHVRLAILDVAGGAQPMTNERGDLALAFNGEIYNHLALRHAIEDRHAFKTRSDTEVLLHLYEEEGEDMLARLDGMFAFALAGPKGMLLARDPLGIKPLYYGRKGNTFIAASELKAFPEMDELHALPAGHAMLAGGQPWRFARPLPPRPVLCDLPLSEALDGIRRRLETAVIKRLMSDVPVGIYLSGGLDSSLVAAMMRPHTVELISFTAGIKGAPDLAMAKSVAKLLGTQHHELLYTAEDVEQALPEVIRYLESFDAPLVRSAIPMYFLSKLAARFVKVVLTGEGADELFAGYDYLRQFERDEDLNREMVNIMVRLQDTNLQRADRVTMRHGLEARVPFLDMDLVRFVARLPMSLKKPQADRPAKWLLRESCKGLLPLSILERKKLKFSEGAGSEEVMARRVRDLISPEEFERERKIAPGFTLRSPEELHYYRIWRSVMGTDLPPELVGRTCDHGAAA